MRSVRVQTKKTKTLEEQSFMSCWLEICLNTKKQLRGFGKKDRLLLAPAQRQLLGVILMFIPILSRRWAENYCSIIGHYVSHTLRTDDIFSTISRIGVHNWRSRPASCVEYTGATSISDKYAVFKVFFNWHVIYSAIICEGLRLSYGVSSRSQRISPHEPLHFKSNIISSKLKNEQNTVVEYQIPPGTPVGMTSVLIHHNPGLFPDPKTFSPERWLNDKGQRCRELDGYMMSFSKGSRQCIGIK